MTTDFAALTRPCLADENPDNQPDNPTEGKASGTRKEDKVPPPPKKD